MLKSSHGKLTSPISGLRISENNSAQKEDNTYGYLVSSIYKYIYYLFLCSRAKNTQSFPWNAYFKIFLKIFKKLHFSCGPQTSTKLFHFGIGVGGAAPFWFGFLGLVLYTGVKRSDKRL